MPTPTVHVVIHGYEQDIDLRLLLWAMQDRAVDLDQAADALEAILERAGRTGGTHVVADPSVDVWADHVTGPAWDTAPGHEFTTNAMYASAEDCRRDIEGPGLSETCAQVFREMEAEKKASALALLRELGYTVIPPAGTK